MIGYAHKIDPCKGKPDMLDTIRALVQQKDLCVLATSGEDGPHTSLMAYAYSPDCSEIYLVTSRKTRKYLNIQHTSHVSLMVDTRDENERNHIRALTISGRAEEIEETRAVQAVRRHMLARHPHLSAFTRQPDTAWICVRVDAFQLLDGIDRAYNVRLSPKGDS
jgi:nitroimidazol reductase NimA-like FMN-containing flavoprotein (pyridoxamine 5'-phosphate oxidase superfamily)